MSILTKKFQIMAVLQGSSTYYDILKTKIYTPLIPHHHTSSYLTDTPPPATMNRHIEYLNTYYEFFATDSVTCYSLPPLYTWLKIFSATSTGIFFLPDPYIFGYLVIRHILLTATPPPPPTPTAVILDFPPPSPKSDT